jgi:hypothetical protein
MKLKLFEASLKPDPQINADGFYMMVLAVDIQNAIVRIQQYFNNVYGGVIDVEKDGVSVKEIKPPFGAGDVLYSISIPNRTIAPPTNMWDSKMDDYI